MKLDAIKFLKLLKKSETAMSQNVREWAQDCTLDLLALSRKMVPQDHGAATGMGTSGIVALQNRITGYVAYPGRYTACLHDPAKYHPPSWEAVIAELGQYRLGLRSATKQLQFGVEVGPFYLYRAVQERKPVYLKALAEAMRAALHGQKSGGELK